MKPSIPSTIQNRNQNMLPNPTAIPMFNTTPMVPFANNQTAISYTPQNYFGHQAIVATGFIPNNYSSGSSQLTNESSGRRKSIIGNINPLINEQKVAPMDLSMFPVSLLYVFIIHINKPFVQHQILNCN